MKIAVLAPQLIPSHPAGGQMLKVVRALASEHEFTVFGRSIDESLRGRVHFQKIPVPAGRPLLITYVMQFLFYGQLFKKLALHEKFEVIHSIEGSAPFSTVTTMHYCAEAAALALIRGGVFQHIGIRRPYYELLYRIGLRMERTVVNNPYLKRLVVVSEGLKREILYYYRPSVEPLVIPNSVDVDRFAYARQYREPTRKELGIARDEIVGAICALGNWQRKGLDVLIEAVASLPRNLIKILVIGGGPIQTYRRLCEKKGVSNAFIFTGFVHDVERFYSAADFFVLPTAYEALPIVSLEAAAAGLPLLVTRAGDILENFVEDGMNGFHIERDPTSIANAISFLVANREKAKAMGAEAQRRAQAFGVARMVDAYRQLYDEIGTRGE
ncbi:MAG: glycosyltransferase family 4 protein [Armatimonadota bacterium]